MGSLETGLTLKRDHHLLRSSSSGRNTIINGFGQRQPRSRFARLVLFKKIDYLQWICTVAVFFFFVFLFQMFFLPGSVMEEDIKSGKKNVLDEENSLDLTFLKELDFGEDIKFEPSKLLAKFGKEVSGNFSSRTAVRFGYRKPKLALIFPDLSVNPYQILMVSVATALQEIGYEIEIFSLEDGPVQAVWRDQGIPLNIIANNDVKISVDWLNYNGILVNSLGSASVLSWFMQEPFKNMPLIWTIHDLALAARLRQYVSSGQVEIFEYWRKVFSRASVVVFPNFILPMVYSVCDAGNYFVIPGSPAEAWEAETLMALKKDNLQLATKYGGDDFIILVVGSQLLYKGLWLEHAVVLQALLPIFMEFPRDSNFNSHLKIVILTGYSSTNYSMAVETIAQSLRYPKGVVKHATSDEDADNILSKADLVVYGSFLEEQSFPSILLKAMCLEKPIIAPDLSMIRKYVDDRVNGYLFPKGNAEALTEIVLQLVSNGKLTLLARNTASIAKRTAKNLMVSESVEGYASLLEKVLPLPSEVATPLASAKILPKLKAEWQWHLFEHIASISSSKSVRKVYQLIDKIEKQFNHTHRDTSAFLGTNDTFVYSIWEDEKTTQMAIMKKRREDEELKDRSDQPLGTWDDVYRNVRRTDRLKNDLHERDEGELERTGQTLCIYEPYFGEGTWPFLHHTSLYRGLGLSTKGRRPGTDDIDAPSRLPLLNNPYYRGVLGEYGAFFAIANRIDRIHKNSWIGFQSWRATARKESLSKFAEASLLDAIEGRRYGDSLYFWVRLDMDPRNPLKQDFWSFCDTINAGNCQFAFSEVLKKMYGIKHNLTLLPSMPTDDGSWSVMHCWALPTRSFLEFVMFSRMFVDALDSQFYDEHHKSGHCYLSLSKDKHCYSRVLELLINVWAYHSARRIVYVDPKTGVMQEQHKVKGRRGQMWVKWFQPSTLKSMDEELAEESDSDHPKRRWIWPQTGEVFWQGIYERERNMRNKEKEKRKQKSKDKIKRMRNRVHQRTLGKYVKPLPEVESNSTALPARLLR